ncbi:MAG: (d)CMP kinase [Bauldia sp.]
MIIAIDGPAASGKGTLGRRLAAHYRLNYLDTGLTYRAVAAALLDGRGRLDDEPAAIAAARRVDFATLNAAALGGQAIGEAASRVAVLPKLRSELVLAQQAFASRAPGAVLDGRDIGTVVCPGADVKLFVTASLEKRAERRAAEVSSRGEGADLASIRADIERRDHRDYSRAASPLRQAEDAYLLDTSEMDIETAFRAAVDIVEKARAKRG